ncbi:sodium/proline symporter PutP [Actinomycetaceae bacterium WB03_NA08]|uniref:Sodium/proline symporter n=1 Tax=Scrofimicrobium canadense TaxID=2652290 RepID=A0A6N7W646_9ACTO|nr:sodium/proline symporter PutP [Scrofimicrobium canadense]MSS83706.1 sodium/proline symporter PutP [Scrofimicrobium canadense]
MESEYVFQLIAMVVYTLGMVTLGVLAYRQTRNLDDYVLGGRSLGPFVAALSVGASDMSGWLLMGLPGAIYMSGLIEGWIAVGLTVGAWVNWKVIAPRLRAYTERSADTITIPTFLESRVKDRSRMIRIIAGLIILIFFTFYVSSGLVAGGVFFESSFGMEYRYGMLFIGTVVVLYTLLGGFLAVSWTDVVQGLMMVTALLLVPLVGIFHVGGFGNLVSGIQAVDPAILNPFGDPAKFGVVTVVSIISALAWGLGYFGQPHILVRFMAIRNAEEAKAGRRYSIIWMAVSVLGAGTTALVGVAVYHHDAALLPDPEAVFISLGQLLFHPLIAGFWLAAILAAIMSTLSSQLLVTSSAIVEDIYHVFTKKDLRSGLGMWLRRLAVLVVAVVAGALAWKQNDTILALVAFAWAGFGSSFGPVVILSMYWRKLTWQGTLAAMIVGAVVVGAWGTLSDGVFDVYEMIPGFLLSLLVAVGVSLAAYRTNPEIDAEFDHVEEVAKRSFSSKNDAAAQ